MVWNLLLLNGEMLVLPEGEEFIVENLERWAEYQPKVGSVLEVDGSATDVEFPPGVWLAFVVKDLILEDDGSYMLEVKFVGSAEAEVNKEMSISFNRRGKGYLHLCGGKPCLSAVDAVLHVTRFRVYSAEGIKKDYLTASMIRQMKKWAGDTAEEPAPTAGEPGRKRRPALKKAPEGPKEPAKGLTQSGEGRDSQAAFGRLSSRLTELRTRLHQARPPKPSKVEAPNPAGDVEELESSSNDGSDCAREPLDTGTELTPLGPLPWEETPQKAVSKKKIKKKKKSKTQLKDHGDRYHRKQEGKGLLAISDGTLRGTQSQLATRAAAVAEEKRKGKDRSKRSSRSSVGKKLLKILTEKSGRKGKDSSKETRRKKKGKRGRMKPDPDGSGDGPTESSDSSYSTDWGSGNESLSDQDELEPPLRKRAKQHPGSVLKMLLTHARSQLDQSSKVALEPSTSMDVTSGVKMASYFSICVKPGLSQNMGAQRDLHHLSLAIDLLRQGDLTLLGDCLASRFVAIHQAAVDGGWGAARHLELFPMEESTATNNAVLLETRRHARLAAKAAGFDGGSWRGYGKGKGGKKGKKSSWDNHEWSEKGSGKKGKEKGNQKGGWGHGDGNKWKDSKEPATEKKG